MRRQLESVYESLYDDYSVLNPVRPVDSLDQSLVDSIRKAIQNAELNRLNSNLIETVKLRSDAKYFLVILFIQMVELPLRLEKTPLNVPGISTLDTDIIRDIKYILREAYRVKAIADVKEITAHTILTIMDENWNRLSISKFELWNKS